MKKTLLIVVTLLFLLAGAPLAKQVEEIRIGDSRGDFGPPSPFLHYPRGPGYLRMSWVFDTLIWKGPQGPIPALAKRWSDQPDSTRYDFELNPAAFWHDGQPLTAEDVVFTFNYLKKHPYPWVSLDSVSKAEAVNRHLVRVTLKSAYAPFLSEIAGTMPILPKHIWQNIDNPYRFTDSQAFVGSGPYRFTDFDKTMGSYLFTAYADYYQGQAKAARLIYQRTTNPLSSLLNHEVDLASVRPEMVPLLKQKGFRLIEDEHGWVRKLMFNHRRAPLDSKLFRRALAYAIDRQQLIEKSQRGFAAPAAAGLLSDHHPFYTAEQPDYRHNLEKARTLLIGLGYQWNAAGALTINDEPVVLNLLESQLAVAGGTANNRDGAILQQQLAAIGIRLQRRNLEATSADSLIRDWQFDLALSGHGGISGDPRILNDMILPDQGSGAVNSARYSSNPELTRLLAEQLSETDPARRKQLVVHIQQRLAEDLPALPLYYPANISAYDPAKQVDWYYTPGGIGKGIPIPQNKQALLP